MTSLLDEVDVDLIDAVTSLEYQLEVCRAEAAHHDEEVRQEERERCIALTCRHCAKGLPVSRTPLRTLET